MKVCTTIRKFPGGMMVVPLLLGCVVNTFIPQMSETRGSTTRFFKNGTSALVGLFILCSGATISFKRAGMPLCGGATLTALKYIVGVLICWGLNKVFGPTEILGLTPLAVITAVTNSNGAICTAPAEEFNDFTDVGAVVILSLNGGPLLTTIVLGATGLAEIPLIPTIVVIVPLFIGMFLGNVDEELKMFLTDGPATLLPFNGFVLGANTNLVSTVKAGTGDTVLRFVIVVCTDVLTHYICSAIRRKSDPMGMAIGTTDGNAVAVPVSVVVADPSLNPVMEVVTVQIMVPVIVSTVLTPLLTRYFYKKAQREQAETSDR